MSASGLKRNNAKYAEYEERLNCLICKSSEKVVVLAILINIGHEDRITYGKVRVFKGHKPGAGKFTGVNMEILEEEIIKELDISRVAPDMNDFSATQFFCQRNG